MKHIIMDTRAHDEMFLIKRISLVRVEYIKYIIQ